MDFKPLLLGLFVQYCLVSRCYRSELGLGLVSRPNCKRRRHNDLSLGDGNIQDVELRKFNNVNIYTCIYDDCGVHLCLCD